MPRFLRGGDEVRRRDGKVEHSAVGALATENFAWFVQFFQSELLTGAFTEANKEVVGQLSTLNTSAEKTARLAQRLGELMGGGGAAVERKAPGAAAAGGRRNNDGGGKKGRSQRKGGRGGGAGGGGGGGGRATGGNRGVGQGGGGAGAAGKASSAAEAGLFGGKQEFFYRFLYAAESHRLAELLARSLAAKIDSLSSPASASPGGGAEPVPFYHKAVVPDFAERLLKLRVCAKFLGWLRFASVQQEQAAAGGLEFVAARSDHEEIARRGATPAGYFDVARYVRTAARRGSLCLTVPWVLDYLRMMALDPPSYHTPYVQEELLPSLRSIALTWPSQTETGAQASGGLNHTRLCVVALLEDFLRAKAQRPPRHATPMDLRALAVYHRRLEDATRAERCVTRRLFGLLRAISL